MVILIHDKVVMDTATANRAGMCRLQYQ